MEAPPTLPVFADRLPSPLRRGGAALAAATALACSTAPEPATPRGAQATPPSAAVRGGGDVDGAGEVKPVTVEPHSEWAEAVLYFVILDRFADGDPSNNARVDRGAKGAFHGGDLAGLTSRLDELSWLGVTAIWITPVVDQIDGFVTGAGFPDWAYHGYWADDFTQLDPRFGTEEELAGLVREAHARGMKVLLDVVYNHPGYDSAYEKNPATRTWLRSGGECGNDAVTECLAGLPDFRTEREHVAEYLMDAHLGLAERVGLDGFRLDTVKHVGMPFWERHRERVDAELGRDFHLLGEVWGGDAEVLDPWFENGTLDSGFDFGFAGSTLGFVEGRGRPVAYNAYLERRRKPRDGFLLAHYLSTHDVPGALHQLGGDLDKFRLLVALQMTVSGIPTIYYGEEVGRRGGDWPENRSPMPWGERDILPGKGIARDESLREWYRALIAARRAHPALWRGSHQGVDFGTDHLVFLRRDPAAGSGADGGGEVLVAVNRAAEPLGLDLEAPAGWYGAEDVLVAQGGERAIPIVEGRLRLQVPALGVRILSRRGSYSAAGSTSTPASSSNGPAK
ncbi:MAG: alpha-amylase family glycosyl hydrolase [Holophagales bacterium]|nr:alpha-amylase family glycosyl hydrolase [Holophagales bacterium]